MHSLDHDNPKEQNKRDKTDNKDGRDTCPEFVWIHYSHVINRIVKQNKSNRQYSNKAVFKSDVFGCDGVVERKVKCAKAKR